MRRQGYRDRSVGALKANAVRGQGIDVRSANLLVAVASQVVGAKSVNGDNHNIRLSFDCGAREGSKGEASYPHEREKPARGRDHDYVEVAWKKKLYDRAAAPFGGLVGKHCASLGPMKACRALLIFSLCLPLGLSVGVSAQRKTPPPDIFLITIDTLSADHVHCY